MGAAAEAKKIQLIFFCGVVPLIALGFGANKIVGVVDGLESDVASGRGQVQSYYQKGFDVPTKETIEEQLNLLTDAKTTIDSLTSYSCFTRMEMPADVAEKGVYFKEQLYLAQKEFNGLAQSNAMIIPESFGFDDRLPSEDEAVFLMMKLEMIRAIFYSMVNSKIPFVGLVEFVESHIVRNDKEEQMPCRNISVKIGLRGSLMQLKTLLYEIGNMNPFVIVEGMQVKQAKKDELDVVLLVTQLVKEDIA